MAQDPARRRRAVIESLVLAFSRSEAKDLVGTDALCTVLSGQSRDLVVGDELVLQPLWDLLADQPGFSAEAVAPAFCRVESWNERLGLSAVTLPAALADMPEAERRAACDRCIVPAAELEAILRGEADTPPPAAPQAAPKPVKKASTTRLTIDEPRTGQTKKAKPRRPGLEIAAAAVALVAFGFAGVTAYRACSDAPALQEVEIALPDQLPVSHPKRLGGELRATLDDPAWLRRPDDERREAMASALRSVRGEGIDVLVIVDEDGDEVASAQWRGDAPAPAVRLR